MAHKRLLWLGCVGCNQAPDPKAGKFYVDRIQGNYFVCQLREYDSICLYKSYPNATQAEIAAQAMQKAQEENASK
jgi:hypothetical protein